MSGLWQRVSGVRLRGLLATGMGTVVLLAAAGPAQAFRLSTLSISPTTTLAAAHPDVTIATSFGYSDSSDTVQSLQVYFPAGLVGNPNVVSKCSSAQLAADSCPAGSQIGTVSVGAAAAGIVGPITAPGSVYNVTPTGLGAGSDRHGDPPVGWHPR